MKTLKLNIIFLAILFLIGCLSCQKNSTDIVAIPDILSNSSMLKVVDNQDLLETLEKVSTMKSAEYTVWKQERNFYSLYDRYQKLIDGDSMKVLSPTDTLFFYYRNHHLDSKNGLLLDRILNSQGQININGKVYTFPLEQAIVKSNTAAKLSYSTQLRSFSASQSPMRRTIMDIYQKSVHIPDENGKPGLELIIDYCYYINP